MAYFQCMSSSSGAGATITVTYDSSFYNKTMTCTNGTKTYTKTTTSSGSTTFNVSEEGTWTITCNGVSKTVNVVLSYSTQMAITKTVTVYGAVGATISFTDTTGSKTVTLNSSGQGSVAITFIPPSQSITFTDTNVAKNPDNLSQNYSKAITLTDSTTAIYVMPDNVLYWYGNQVNVKSEARPDYTVITYVAPTWNTRDVTVTISGSKKYCYIRPNTDVNATTIHCIATTPLGNSNSYAQIYVGTTYVAYASSNAPVYLTHTDNNGGLPYLMIGNGSIATNTHTTTLYALWYE